MAKHLKVSPAEMRRFMELYDTYGTYAEVARKTGRSSTTVAKYIRMGIAAGFSMEEKEEVVTDNKSITLSGKKTITITLD